MKKRFCKFTTLALAGISAVMLLSACNKEPEEVGSIRVFFPDTVGTDNAEVSQAVSEMAQEKIGVEVEMVFFGSGEYSQKMPKLMATNEQMDIGWDSGDTFVSRARDGAYYDISDDIENYPGLKKLFTDEFLGGVTIDGGVYGIPTLKEMANSWALYIDQATLDRHNIDASKIKTIADMEPVLAALKSEGRNVFGIGNDGTHKAFDLEEHYDTITGAFVVSNDANEKASAKKVVNYYETEEFEAYVRLLHDWFNKGYIPSDILENSYNTFLSKQNADVNLTGISYICYSPLNELGWSKGPLGKFTPIQITDPVISNNSTRGSVYAIFKKSENKQSSLKFLELWNTDKDMNRLIKYGIEGKHYNFVEEDGIKKIQKVEGVGGMYFNQNWRSGNMLLGNIEVGEPANKAEVFNEWNENATVSVVLGFTPDVSTLEAELSACNAVVTGKVAAILTGAIDPDDPEYGIEAIKTDMQKAGSAKVVTELQKQYLTWLKSK